MKVSLNSKEGDTKKQSSSYFYIFKLKHGILRKAIAESSHVRILGFCTWLSGMMLRRNM